MSENLHSLRNNRGGYKMTPNMRKMVAMYGDKAKLPYAALLSAYSMVTNMASIAAMAVNKGIMPEPVAANLQDSTAGFTATIVDALADALGLTDEQTKAAVLMAQDDIMAEFKAAMKTKEVLSKILTNVLEGALDSLMPQDEVAKPGTNKPSDDINPSTLH